MSALADAYERGWQPADVMHVTRRTLGASVASTAAAAVLFQARTCRADDRAPADWRAQLARTAAAEPDAARLADAVPPDAGPDDFAAVLDTADRQLDTRDWLDLTVLWLDFPRLTRLCPPPSEWSAVPVSEPAEHPGTPDPKMLARVRGLLAKAEATEFVEEAETFTAKAQDLMTQYAISAALLDADRPRATTVHSRRIHLDNPYVREKVHLLTAIGEANRVRTVWFDRFAIATVVGDALDLDQTELLFTSLLVQATRAMHAAGTVGTAGAGTGGTTTQFRKAFLFGFSVRIGQRLKETDSRATAQVAVDADVRIDDLLPVLAARSAAVDAEFDRLFPTTKAARGRTVDAVGWHAGQSAADAASLSPGERALPR